MRTASRMGIITFSVRCTSSSGREARAAGSRAFMALESDTEAGRAVGPGRRSHDQCEGPGAEKESASLAIVGSVPDRTGRKRKSQAITAGSRNQLLTGWDPPDLCTSVTGGAKMRTEIVTATGRRARL